MASASVPAPGQDAPAVGSISPSQVKIEGRLMACHDTPAGARLRAEIAAHGPISFERFMDVALYDPAVGYYRTQDPFGAQGDFVTAAQLQPVFGAVVRATLEQQEAPRWLLDVGAGRGEMAPAFSSWRYQAVNAGEPWPPPFSGFIFCNELFDALPVQLWNSSGEVLVDWRGERFVFTAEPQYETSPRSAQLWQDFTRVLERGYVLVIDYGYEEPERHQRFPNGSLMSYRRHRATEDVLAEPGWRDITAHVNFTRLREQAAAGFELVWKKRLSSMVMGAGEELVRELAFRYPAQLKSLLLRFGDSFDALLFRRREDGAPGGEFRMARARRPVKSKRPR